MFKVFNTKTKINESKTLVKHISFDFKCKFNKTTYNFDSKWNNGNGQCECKNYLACNKDYGWNPSTCFCGNGWYLKSIVDEWVIMFDKIINVIDSVPPNWTNTVQTSTTSINVTSTVSRKSDDRKARYKMDC